MMQFREDGFGSMARIGIVYMASSVVMEGEFWAMAAPGVSVHTSRLPLPSVTVKGIESMMLSPALETATRLAAEAPLDALCFGGTSASFLHGTTWDDAYRSRLREWAPGIASTTTSSAALAGLKRLGAQKIALVTPYTDDILDRAVGFFESNGHPVTSRIGLGITDDHALAEVPLGRVVEMVMDTDTADASAIFISCTNLRSVGALSALEDQLQKPVISAVQASFWHCLELMNKNGAKSGYGSLTDLRAAPSGGDPDTTHLAT